MKQSKKKKKIITCLHVCIYVYIHTCTEHCIRHVYMQVLNDLMACTKGVLRFLRSIDPVGFSTKTWQVNARMYFIYIIAVCLYTYTYTHVYIYIIYLLNKTCHHLINDDLVRFTNAFVIYIDTCGIFNLISWELCESLWYFDFTVMSWIKKFI